MIFTEGIKQFPWDVVQKVTFLKNGIIITVRSGNRITAKPPDNKAYLQFYEKARNRLKEDQIEIGDLPNEFFEKT